MEERQERHFLKQVLIFLVSFFVGIFLFFSSLLFLFYNESIKSEIPKKELRLLKKEENVLSTAKVFTYDFKILFVDETNKDFKNPTWILRFAGFLALWFSLTLFLLIFRASSNALGILTFFICLGLFFLIILASNLYIFLNSGKKLLDEMGNTIGETKNSFFDIFSLDFLERLFGFNGDIYFWYFLLFLLFLLLYFLFPRIKRKVIEKIPEKKRKSSFKTYKKNDEY